MEPDKSLQEALLRSHQATEKANQSQHKLQHMASDKPQHTPEQATKAQPELHETPHNLLQSWDTLRKLDEELARKEAENKKNDKSDKDSASNR